MESVQMVRYFQGMVILDFTWLWTGFSAGTDKRNSN